MDLKKIFGHSNDDKKNDDDQYEIEKIKREIENEDKIFQQELQDKDKLLNKFELDQLRQLCLDILGREPESEYFEEHGTGKQIELPLYKNDYVYFIIEELRLSQIKEYALKNKIVSASFFEK